MSLNNVCELGVIGLTSIGQSLAAHHATQKRRVCVYDFDDPSFVPQVVKHFRSAISDEEDDDDPGTTRRCMVPSNSIGELAQIVSTPRKIIIFGTQNDDKKFHNIWDKLRDYLTQGDMVLRWGEEEGTVMPKPSDQNNNVQFYTQSIVGNLSKSQAEPHGIHLLEMIKLEQDRATVFRESHMQDTFIVGGPKKAYEDFGLYILPFASLGHVGSSAACAHYALMVQRAVEFGVAQCLAEGCDLLKKATLHENQDVGLALTKWQEGGTISSYLVEISGKIYYKRDQLRKKGHVIDNIADSIDLNGCDTWFSIESTKLGVPTPTISAALEARIMSNMRLERIDASSILGAPEGTTTPSVLKGQVADDLEGAIYSAWVCVIAEALAVFAEASEVAEWEVNLAECIRMWNLPTSFLKSVMLDKIYSALMEHQGSMRNILLLPSIAAQLKEMHMSWRRIVTLCFASAVPCPCLGASLTYHDSYRSKILPSNLIRAQRDFFGAYGYDRVNEDGWYTLCWTQEHTDALRKTTKKG